MTATNLDIIIYSTPTCPDCRALKAWFASLGLTYTEKDMSDPAIMEEAKARTGVRVAPVTLIGDQVFYGTFASQKPRLVAALGLGEAA
ncbi:glutaredoxin family protein [Sphingomonas koreensis]|jgi:glutaredoxin|uniref:Glutaredoxin family protein n=1 Tax=Sphingomonas koreensis TaxID=93064 RepID=A0A1L6JCC0_9SPHN|nr:glutaredoxin family protein [Sphingomonas koreensis]APR53140.1 NrdH-redoxin [Sphingomonas koreensis]RSU24734.1 glutaredoxin family protein [Sphingomonas koreensis]RSU24960.1 glutaredoxin family protein [Sphingomonas koreensis]RSU26995.1 glutaredoxin family protein [Sphingomonas koreensis]RSU31499.1 glutaredoxin family protein [Sphingomonas koreensis]